MPNIRLDKTEVKKAFKNTNFGSTTDEDVIFDTLLKRAGDYSAGHTAECITTELGLTTKERNLTKKGKQYLYEQTKARLKTEAMNRYQSQAFENAFYPHKGNNPTYVMLGLTEEAGEAAGKVKKMLRDNDGVMNDETKQLLIKELGDVLWYLACSAKEIGVTLSEIAQSNMDKIQSRRERGTLRGSGDER